MNTFLRTMLAAAILSAAGCSPIEKPSSGSIAREGELTISVNTEEQTRGLITERLLPDGSEMGIALFNPDGSNYMNYYNVCYKAENGSGIQLWKPSSQVLLGESEAVLYAYYPYNPNNSGGLTKLYVEVNNYYQDDFMYAGPYTGLNVDNKHIDITMKHALGAVRLTTRRGSYDGAGSIRSIGVGGYCGGYQGYFDLIQGKFTLVNDGAIIYPTTAFQLSDEPNIQDIMLIPTGEPGELIIKMTIDGVMYEKRIPDFLIEAGKITTLDLSVDKGKLSLSSVKVTNWPVYGYGTVSAPADYRIILEGNQEGISIGTVIDDSGNVTITAVPYVSKDASVNPVTFEGTATFSQELNELSGVRTIQIDDLQSNVSVIFDGYTLQP